MTRSTGRVQCAVEEAVGVSSDEATIVRVGQGRNRLLKEDAYDDVAARLMPLLTQMIL